MIIIHIDTFQLGLIAGGGIRLRVEVLERKKPFEN